VDERRQDVFGETEDNEVSVGAAKLARVLRNAYIRGVEEEAAVEFDDLPLFSQAAWEGVGRHMVNLFNFEPREARRLEYHEAKMAELMLKRAGYQPPE
jgi:hypothetical protein